MHFLSRPTKNVKGFHPRPWNRRSTCRINFRILVFNVANILVLQKYTALNVKLYVCYNMYVSKRVGVQWNGYRVDLQVKAIFVIAVIEWIVVRALP